MIIGRKNELSRLQNLLSSDQSEFYAVYGRRRVGKTYLIREAFNYRFTFQHTGLANAKMSMQLAEFQRSLQLCGAKRQARPKNWYEAFWQLQDFLLESKSEKKVLFLDELPWMDTAKSNFISALEHFWNNWCSTRKDIILIVCGSATSWIMDKIILDHGGLHNRLTGRILLQPFSLAECESYASMQGLKLSRKDLMEAYMIWGGIPYYWSLLQRGQSLSQNIDRLFFHPTGEMALEFQALYASLFKNSQMHVAIVETLGKNNAGMQREQVLSASKIEDSSAFSKALNDLEYCGFIRKYNALDKKKKGTLYQLIDNFTLFYYRFISENSNHEEHFWSSSLNTSVHNSWAGLAFERVCMQHIPQIKHALGISGVLSNVYSWSTKKNDEHPGAQIDLLIDRQDNIINLCEARFSTEPYIMTQNDEDDLLRRQTVFRQVTKTKKAIHPILLTTYPPVENAHLNVVQAVITMENLFFEI